MYQVIARKYRPATFSELISQEHVRTTLENAITQNRIAHGYILSGQRGTGKTTVARIIARCLNCFEGPTATPCGVCASCREISLGQSVDVIEIDAASNRGINEMRELRDNVRYRPARDKYKVFIVDEAHQITSEAFNALLKTLEEPPEWVVFILCTTESHKIPVTIASRCQQFSFCSVQFNELMSRMRFICAQENINATDEVLSVIAHVGEGSVRDSLSALDQAIACCGTTLEVSEVRSLLGLFSLESLGSVIAALRDKDAPRMLEIVGELERNGRSLHHFCRELARYLRNLLVARLYTKTTHLIAASEAEQTQLREASAGFSEEDLTRYLQLTLDLYRDMQVSIQPRLHLEMGLLRLLHASRLVSIEDALRGIKPESKPETKFETKPAPARLSVAPPPPSPSPQDQVPPSPPADKSDTSDLRGRLVDSLSAAGSTFAADGVAHSDVTEQGPDLIIVSPPEYAKSLSMSENQIRKAAETVLGRSVRLKITAGSPVSAASAPVSKPREAAGEEVMARALADSGVKQFQEAFPNSELSQVRNLKE